MSASDKDARANPGYSAVREFALRFPEAYEDFPWGHCAIKVRKKIFVSLGVYKGRLSMSMKLTDSNFEALLLPFTEPTHYGMGKHGWVTASFAADEAPPVATICGWVEESFRAIAPKRLVAKLDEDGLAPKAVAARQPVETVRKTAKKKKKKAGAGQARARKA